jgi:hypothetical protein
MKEKLAEGGFTGFKDEGHGLKFMRSLVQEKNVTEKFRTGIGPL